MDFSGYEEVKGWLSLVTVISAPDNEPLSTSNFPVTWNGTWPEALNTTIKMHKGTHFINLDKMCIVPDMELVLLTLFLTFNTKPELIWIFIFLILTINLRKRYTYWIIFNSTCLALLMRIQFMYLTESKCNLKTTYVESDF